MANDVHEDHAVNAVLRIWDRIGLSNRLAIATGLALSVAFMAAVILAAHLSVLQAKERVDTALENTLVNLSQMVTVAHQSGQPPSAFFGRYALTAEMLRINFHSVGDATQNVEVKNPAPPRLEAPAWFMQFSRLNDWILTRPVLADHRKVGEVSMTVSANGVVNDIWRSLCAQILVMASASAVVFLAVWLGLRSNLKPLEMLARGSAALGRGEFSQRLGLTGSREIRTTLKAFNAMADNLQQLVGALNRSERLYASLVEAAPVGIFRTDAQGHVLYANDVLLQMTGVARDDLSAERWAAAYHPDDRARVGNAWLEAMRTRTVAEATTYRFVRPDGSETWAHSWAVPQFDENGQFEGYVGVVTDITAERALRVKVERSEQNLNVTLRSIGDAVLVTDTAGRVMLMNPVAEALTGWTETEAIGRPSAEVFRIISEETRAAVDSPVDRVLKEGVIVGLANHTLLIAKDGTERPIADSGAPIRYVQGGEINGVVLVFRDQSDEYRMQKALRDSERLYATLISTVPVGVFQADRDGNAIFGNETMEILAGLGKTGALLQEWITCLHPDDRARIAESWREASINKRGIQETYRYLHVDGEVIWARTSMSPVLDAHGEFQGYIGGIVDITAEQHHLQRVERLQRLYATLSRVNSIIVQVDNDAALFEQVCQAIAHTGCFDRAMITLVDWERRKLREVSSAGVLMETPPTFLERDLDDIEARSLNNVAVLEGAMTISNDYCNDPRVAQHIRTMGEQMHFGAVAAVPIQRAGRIAGALSIVSREMDFFTDEVVALVAEIARDISFALDNLDRAQHKRLADVALARSEQNLNVTLRSIGDAVLVTDTAGRVTLMNPVAEALTGWAEAEALGRPSAEVFHIINEGTRMPVDSPVGRVLKEGVIVGLANHTILIAKDGTERPIADSGAPIRYEQEGEINGVVLVFRDQSEEYRMQKALRDSEQLYSTLAESVHAGIYLADTNGELRYANGPFLKMIDAKLGELSTQAAAAAIHPDDREGLAKAWYAACQKSGLTDFGAYRYVHRDGRLVWAHGVANSLCDEHGQVTRIAGIVTDITNEHEHLHELERLSRFNATMSQVNSAIAHSTDETRLYEAICVIMIEQGGFTHSAVTCPDWARRKAVLVASMMTGQPTLSSDLVELDMDGPQAQNLTTLSLLSGIAATANDIDSDVRIGEHFRRPLRVLQARSANAVAFHCFGEVVAALTLISSEKNFFSNDILELIDEIGRGVSHALENMARDRQRQKAEEALARNEERLRLGLGVTKTGMYEVNYEKMAISLDAISARLMDLGNDALEIDIEAFAGMLSDELKTIINPSEVTQELMAGTRDTFSMDIPVKSPDGSMRWVRNYGGLTTERGEDGKPVRLLGVISDITATRSMEERDRLAATVFDNSGEAIMITDARRRIVMINQAFVRNAGYQQEEILGEPVDKLRSDHHDAAFYAELARTLDREGSWQGEIWRKRKNGEVYPALAAISLVKDRDDKLTNIVIQEIDISTQKAFEQRISHLAYRDALTELPNRALLRDRVEQSIAAAHREGGTVTLLFLDLDHFKNINDSLGHQVGDSLLKEIARRLTEAVRETDTVGRLGGDEFLLLLPNADADAAAHVAQKLLEECARPLLFGIHSLTVTPSIGISLYPKDGKDFDELLKTADTAMYRAKEEGRNAYRFYAPEMNTAVFQRMVLESSLRRAIENDEFVLHFQPKFELRHQTLVGVEALIRWRQPELGMVSPAQFIPVAEESGLIEAIGKWVLETACRQAQAWRDAGLPPLRVAVNFSARQFAARNIAELVAQTLKDTGLSGDGLEMEITESLLAQDMEYTLDTLRAVKRLGVHIAVDDFGTGYSSLSYLKRFPIDRLKIDQSFVRDIAEDVDDRAIATAVVTMGHSLGMRVIAEGVETEKQIEILRDMGCDEVQGFYLGRPMPAEEMTALLGEWSQKTQSRGTKKSV